jgi:2-iminobutanoate/2-iminopropanoate deaminase
MPSTPSNSSSSAADTEYYSFPVATSLPFSAAVRVGNMLYVSGQMGTNETGTQLVPGGIEAETRQTLANMKAILERHGSSLDRVVKCTVMMADMAEWPAMNRVYVQHFPAHLPARSAFGCSALALGGRVEIECIATV